MLKRMYASVVGILLLTPWATGQSTFGSIRGTTLDQTDSFIPQATMTLHNVGENTGLEMNGLPKGIRLEAVVTVSVVFKLNLLKTLAEPITVARGKHLKISYEIECSENVPQGIWLGASFRDDANNLYHSTSEDKPVSLEKGVNICYRTFTIPENAPLGEQKLATSLWRGIAGNSENSKWIAGRPPILIQIVE